MPAVQETDAELHFNTTVVGCQSMRSSRVSETLSPSRSRNCTHCLTLMEMVSISCRIQFAAKPGTTSTFAWIRNTPRRITASSVSATKISQELYPAPPTEQEGMAGAD